MFQELVLANKEFLKLLYALLIILICSFIFLKSDRLFKISDYQGLRYLRNAFLFYGLFIFTDIILGNLRDPLTQYPSLYYNSLEFLSVFLVISAGFFLLYSLLWKYLEKEKKYHSVFNLNILVFLILALILTSLNVLLDSDILLNISQTILFLIIGIISLLNYSKDTKKQSLSKYYLIAVTFGFISWLLHSFSSLVIFNPIIQTLSYISSTLFFFLFFYMTLKITNSKW